jgi:hypothetical protein
MYAKTAMVLVSALVFVTVGDVAHAASVEKQKFKGTQASTSFSAEATITCADGSAGSVFATGFLSGSETITKQTGSPKTVTNGIFVEIDSYSNSCTGTNLGGAFGGVADGFAPPNKRLDSAGLEGTTFVQDFGSGAQIPVALDVVIVGTGPVSASQSTTKTKTVQGPCGPVTITIARSANANRSGDASGTITIEGVELKPTFSITTLVDNSNTEITIEKKR